MAEHADDGMAVAIPLTEAGLPCFDCFFDAVITLFTDAHLASIPLGRSGLDDEAEAKSRRFGAAIAYVADALATVAVKEVEDGAHFVLDAFVARLRHTCTKRIDVLRQVDQVIQRARE
jgi:hypothetical protein